MNPLNALFEQIANTVNDHSSPNTPGPAYDGGGLLGQLAGLFGQHAQQNGQDFDPGQFGNVKSSDEDPYGDPGAAGGGAFGNVKSSDEDPYGDPGAR